tara:strand:+ start:716 stop:934 length:219 start_codon:yes stop_codon:yes gene_type:complete
MINEISFFIVLWGNCIDYARVERSFQGVFTGTTICSLGKEEQLEQSIHIAGKIVNFMLGKISAFSLNYFKLI